jgi:predicted NAD/FAD-binding protein
MIAAMWSTPPGTPPHAVSARALAHFLHTHSLLPGGGAPAWRTFLGGSRAYVERVLGRLHFAQTHLGAEVLAVRPTPGGVMVRTGAGEVAFDHVVLAVHADAALKLLDPTEAEAEVLGGIARWTESRVVLHRDERVWSILLVVLVILMACVVHASRPTAMGVLELP